MLKLVVATLVRDKVMFALVVLESKSQPSLKERSRVEKTNRNTRCRVSDYDKVCSRIRIAHLRAFSLSVVLAVLEDIKRIDPNVLHAEVASTFNHVSQYLR